ncbi:MAG: diguanylate cyclase [Exilibacterium sp.]
MCRYGGEEFIVLLPNTTPEYAAAAAEKLRRLVESTPIHYNDTDINFTISIGVGGLVPQPEHQPLDLLSATDKAMYQVKSSGRNGFHLATISSTNVHA